jgi:hypothetical protein
MAVTQALRWPDEVRGPQWRQPRLNGVSMAGAAATGAQPLAGLGEAARDRGWCPRPRWLAR